MRNDQLQLQYWKRLDKAEEHYMKGGLGNARKARDILLEMRRYPDLGIIPRARMNLLLARVFWDEPNDHYPRLYARECLDLVDIFRQKYDGQWNKASEAQMVEMENHSKDILDDLERFRLEKEADEQQPKDTTSIGGNLESLHITSPVKKDPQLNIGTTEWEEDGVVFTRVSTWTPEAQKECDEERKKNPPFVIEGYLRRSGKYKPMEEYVPLSRDEGLTTYDDDEEDEEDQEEEEQEKMLESAMSKHEDNDGTMLPQNQPSSTMTPLLEAMEVDHDLLISDSADEIGRE